MTSTFIGLRALLRIAPLVLCSFLAAALGCGRTAQSRAPLEEWSGSTTVPLIAGHHTKVGTVTASIEAGRLLVKYALEAPWTMESSHLDIEEDWRLIPQTSKSHNPIPGHFAQSASHAPAVTEYVYQRALSWAPGVTLSIAAHAEVVRAPGGSKEGAWADGTRFTPQGSWATYFTFTPTVEAVEAQGNNWVLMHVSGTTTDGTNQTFNDGLYMLNGADGLAEAPLPGDLRADLADGASEDDLATVVSQSIVGEIVASEQAGALTPALQAIAEPLDPEPPSNNPGPLKLFGRCKDKDLAKSSTVDLRQDIPLWSGEIGENVDADLTVSGNIQGTATAEIQMSEKRYATFGVCIPYAATFKSAHAFGTASINYGATLTGTIRYSNEWKRQLADPKLFAFWFMAGPLPVRVGAKLPITIGAKLTASASGSLTYNGEQDAVGSFDYTCTRSGCTGASSYDLSALQPASITGGVTARIEPSLWAEVAFRPFLYDEWFLYVEVGARPYMHGDLWGYYGNNCGDADDDGDFETVSALTFDLDWELKVPLRFAMFDERIYKEWNVGGTGRRHIKFWDLIGSPALSPMLAGPSSATAGQPAPYLVSMRPCWPYESKVNYRLDWGDGAIGTFSGELPGWTSASHVWQQAGTMAVGLTAISDEHGRELGKVTSRQVTVTGAPPPPGTWTPWLNRDAPGGNGDFETLVDFVNAGQACQHPLDVQCETLTGVDWTLTGQVYTCDTTTGGVCRNADQTGGSCLDYRVRFLCP